MKARKYIAIVLLLTCIASACRDNILESQPRDRYTGEQVWNDINLVSLYVNNIYAGLVSEYDIVNTLMQASITDEAESNRTNNSQVINMGQYNASNSPYNEYWSHYYSKIRLCNTFLEKIPTVNAADQLKRRLTGEVFFLRAYFYHCLMNLFGPFPIVRQSLSLNDDLLIPRGSPEECIQFIVQDLDSAASILPLNYVGSDIGRVTEGTALALKCRVLLYAKQWEKSSEAARAVMGLGIYSLFPSYTELFYPENDNNPEVIFDKQYIAETASGQSSSIDVFNAPSNFTGSNSGINDPTQNLVNLYEMADGSMFDWSNPQHATRPYYNRDPRLEASIMHDSTTWQGLIIDMRKGTVFNPQTRPSRTGYYMKKFLNPNYIYRSGTGQSSSQNFIFIRYAEVLLNYAEAQFRLGNIEESRTYVNMIRARPQVDMPAISQADYTWERYVNERTIELAFEGLRLWDIRRWEIGPQSMGSTIYGVEVTMENNVKKYRRIPVETRVFDPKMYLFPIPKAEIDKYPAHNPLRQNPGWQ